MKNRMIASFIQFLSDELKNEGLSPDQKETIEVAIQCLGNAFELNLVDGSLPSKKPLLEIFENYMKTANDEAAQTKELTEEEKASADAFKVEGNEHMKAEKFEEAIAAYTKAIEIDGTNPIYYSNRAAAYSRLDKHLEAIEDCRVAIRYDPNYSKAYCRMGFAYVNLNDHQRARDCYKKAYDLDPSESNLKNLKLAEDKINEEMKAFNAGAEFGNILNNPGFMELAGKVMSDPNMQSMMANMFGNVAGQSEGGEPGGFEALLRMGQQFAEQIKSSNPELIEKIREAKENPK